jgi:hypothetical protein
MMRVQSVFSNVLRREASRISIAFHVRASIHPYKLYLIFSHIGLTYISSTYVAYVPLEGLDDTLIIWKTVCVTTILCHGGY